LLDIILLAATMKVSSFARCASSILLAAMTLFVTTAEARENVAVAWEADYGMKGPRHVHATKTMVTVLQDNGKALDVLSPTLGTLTYSIALPDPCVYVGVFANPSSGEAFYFCIGLDIFYLVDTARQEIMWNVTIDQQPVGIVGTPVFNDDGTEVYFNSEGMLWKFDVATGASQTAELTFIRETESQTFGPSPANVSPLTYHEGSLYTSLAEGRKNSYCTRPALYRYDSSTLILLESWEFTDEDCGDTSPLSCCGSTDSAVAPTIISPESDYIVISINSESAYEFGTLAFDISNLGAGPLSTSFYDSFYNHPHTSGGSALFAESGIATAYDFDGSVSTVRWSRDLDFNSSPSFFSVDYG
jgi:hypothetical protein